MIVSVFSSVSGWGDFPRGILPMYKGWGTHQKIHKNTLKKKPLTFRFYPPKISQCFQSTQKNIGKQCSCPRESLKIPNHQFHPLKTMTSTPILSLYGVPPGGISSCFNCYKLLLYGKDTSHILIGSSVVWISRG